MKYRLLGRSGLRVSELCLGTMTFGDDWGWGADKENSKKIFEKFAAAGGNFIDTSNNYTNGSSEKFVGEFIKAQRDEFVVATKYTLFVGDDHQHDPNHGGNSRKSMHRSIENSLRRLDTEYIDMLYLHMWDFMTPVEEVLRAVDDLVRAGKVMYFGFSDTPAWVVSHAVALAEQYGWTRPVAYQAPYSIISRGVERAELPMSRAFDLSFMAWGVVSGGVLTGKYSNQDDEPRRESEVSPERIAQGEAVVKLANEIGQTPAQVAINWVRQQSPNTIPILGARTEAQIEDALGCLEFELHEEQMAQLNELADFKLDFPLSFLTNDHVRGLIFGKTFEKVEAHRSPLR